MIAKIDEDGLVMLAIVNEFIRRVAKAHRNRSIWLTSLNIEDGTDIHASWGDIVYDGSKYSLCGQLYFHKAEDNPKEGYVLGNISFNWKYYIKAEYMNAQVQKLSIKYNNTDHSEFDDPS